MQTKQWSTVDKSGWGEGPWQDECDKKQWQDEATGLPCLIVRNHSGALCGYVGVTEAHPWYGKSYSDLNVAVHGGLTFADACQPGDADSSICHVPDAGEPDNVWWFGFDCAHYRDASPSRNARDPHFVDHSEVYRDIEYVQAQVTNLARQIAAQAAA
jgi:hypothetical protein